jgi:hypothetical protein
MTLFARLIRSLLSASALLAMPQPAWPQSSHTYVDPIDQQPRDCYARPRAGGPLMLVKGQHNNALRFWAYATWDGAGHPLMIFNIGMLSQRPPIVTRFAFYHECAHLVLRTTDEVQANCEALRQMRAHRELSRSDELLLQEEHYRLTGLGSRYLGSGRGLWDATMECARTGTR